MWHHICSIRSGTTHSIYGDGVFITSNTVSNGATDNTALGIGGLASGGNSWQGYIDDARMYNRDLSSSDVTELYNYTGAGLTVRTLPKTFTVTLANMFKVFMGRKFAVYKKTAPIPFSPSDIAGLKLWLKPESLSGSGGSAIASWTDSSGNGNTATQGSGGLQPTLQLSVLNGYSAARFDGNDDVLESNFQVSPNFSLFVVTKLLRNTPYGTIDTVFSTRNYVSSSPRAGTISYLTNVFATNSQTWGNTENDGTGNAVTTYIAGQANSSLGNWPTGVYSLLDSIATNGTQATDLTQIGANTGSAFWGNTDIVEVIYYDSALSTGNRQSVEDYIGAKYGITITH